VTTCSGQLDPVLGRIMAHLRAHAVERRRLERSEAAPGELDDRRELIGRLQVEPIRRWRQVAPLSTRRP
jgi:hypothetical protein